MPRAVEIQSKDISLTFAKGLDVLRAFDGDRKTMTSAEVAKRCALDRAVARRLLLTLTHAGYLKQDSSAFTLTPKVLTLAGAFLQSRQFGKLIQPALENHARDLGATLSLAVLDDGFAVYVAQAAVDPTRVSFGFTVGSHLPVLPTAIGRALLAAQEADIAAGLIKTAELTACTDNTLLDRSEIAKIVRQVRVDRVVQVRDEFEKGATGFAAPVINDNGTVYAVGCSIPSVDVSEAADMQIYSVLRHCARDLQSIL